MNILNETTNAIRQAYADYTKAVEDAMAPGLEYIAKNYGENLGLIAIVGQTPSFNDGDPCEHSTDFAFGYADLENWGLEHYLDDWFEDQPEEIEAIYNKKVVVPAEVKEFVTTALDPYFESKLHTNYFIAIRFENGTYEIIEDEYDCGY
jgi:hypothetical protein